MTGLRLSVESVTDLLALFFFSTVAFIAALVLFQYKESIVFGIPVSILVIIMFLGWFAGYYILTGMFLFHYFLKTSAGFQVVYEKHPKWINLLFALVFLCIVCGAIWVALGLAKLVEIILGGVLITVSGYCYKCIQDTLANRNIKF